MADIDKIILNNTQYDIKDASVPSWAKQSTKPSYTANEVGALPSNTHIPNDIKVGSVAGKLYRNNVGGTGNFSISGNSGCIPNLTAGTFLVAIYAKSATQSYTFRFNFGSTTYDLSTTNGEINDLRTVTISSASTFSGSVVTSSGVASGTILYVTMYNYLTPIQTVGPAAVTNRYSDLDGIPTIPTVNNGTLTIQKNGTSVATFTANQSGSSTANITVPTTTSDLTNDSGFLGDADVSYDANTKTLIIGGSSVTTYSVISTYSGNISSNSYYTINDGEHVALSFPLTVSEGDKFYCFIEASKSSQPVVTMGGNAITVTMSDPSSWYFTIQSVTGDIVISD